MHSSLAVFSGETIQACIAPQKYEDTDGKETSLFTLNI